MEKELITETRTYTLPWLKMQAKCRQFAHTEVKDWNEYQLLGYVMAKTGLDLARAVNDSDYKFYKETAPSRHPHLQNMRRLIATLHNQGFIPCKGDYNPALVKRYLDWCFRQSTGTVFSINYFTNEEQIARFNKRNVTAVETIDRTTELPSNVFEFMPPTVKTYGDLSFYAQIPEIDLDWSALGECGITQEQLRKVV